jgi:hypothetical protein
MRKFIICAALGAMSLAGCGDSGSDASPAPPPPETANINTVGPITGFGSIHLNGHEFGTASATVTMDDESATLADLRVGMMVSVRGTLTVANQAMEANQIRFVDDAEGPVSALNRETNSFIVLGRTILFDELTVFDDVTPETLANGNVVQVSGQWRSENRIQATHIERKAHAYQAGMRMEVKGEITSLNLAARQFNLGSQVCDYSNAVMELGGEQLANGMYVEVGSTQMMQGGDMLLDRVQARDRDQDRDHLCDSDCDFEVEGYITEFASAVDFEVDGQPVMTTDSTVYVNGTVDTLALDVKVAINGTLDTDDVLIADRIVFRLPSVVEIEADIESIETTNTAVTLLGIPVATNEFTMFRDDSAAATPEFGFDDLAVGDRIESRAYIDDDNLIASRIERDDPDEDVTLKAPVDVVERPAVTLLGVMVFSDENTVFQNAAKEVIDADTFFSIVAAGSLVKAEGTYDGTSILASELYLRECEASCL